MINPIRFSHNYPPFAYEYCTVRNHLTLAQPLTTINSNKRRILCHYLPEGTLSQTGESSSQKYEKTFHTFERNEYILLEEKNKDIGR